MAPTNGDERLVAEHAEQESKGSHTTVQTGKTVSTAALNTEYKQDEPTVQTVCTKANSAPKGQEKEIMSRLYAPEMHKVDEKWYIYFSGAPVSEAKYGKTASSQSIRLFCMECTGNDPWNDSWIFKGCLNEDLWAIDASAFTLNGVHYALFAEIVPGEGNVIGIGRLSSPWEMEKETVRICRAEYDWEKMSGLVNEGPFFFTGPTGRRFLLYSANNVNSPYYCLNTLELVGDDPMDPDAWVKKPETTSRDMSY